MSAASTLVGPLVVCANPIRHTPAALIFDQHHVRPESWGGQTDPSNLVTVCPTCHYSTHILIDLYVTLGRPPKPAEILARFGHRPSPYIGQLAAAAWALRPPHPTPTS